MQCAFCRGVAGEWVEGDVPMIEHRRHFPRCPFICNLPVGNVPIGEAEEEEEGDEIRSGSEVDVEMPNEPTIVRGPQVQYAVPDWLAILGVSRSDIDLWEDSPPEPPLEPGTDPETQSVQIHRHQERRYTEDEFLALLGVSRMSYPLGVFRERRLKRGQDVEYDNVNEDWYLEFGDNLCEGLSKTRHRLLMRVSKLPKPYFYYLSPKKFENYEARLESFHKPTLWRSWAVMPSMMAKAGFYYTGEKDRVRCYSCNLVLGGFEPRDLPFLEHMKYTKFYCKHLVELTGNDCLDNITHDSRTKVYPALLPKKFHEKMSDYPNIMRTYSGPNQIGHIHELSRAKTFQVMWTENHLPSPQKMAAAGWMYEGPTAAKCFYCSLIITNWTPDMDPVTTHMTFFPQCFMSFVAHVGRSPLPEDYNGDKACFYCTENEANIISIDCQHVIGCASCSSKFSTCPKCKVNITSVMRMFM